MPNPQWKQFERNIAAWIAGRRHPSTGLSNVDVESDIVAIECKYRQSTSIPAWLREMFRQMRDNKYRHPEKHSVAVIGEHFGRGIPINTYIVMEVDIKNDSFDVVLTNLLASRAEIEAQIEDLIGTATAEAA